MKISLKYSIVLLLSLFLFVFMLGGFFLPAQIHVQNAIEIKASPPKIFPFIAEKNSWTSWSIWSKKNDESIQFDTSQKDTLKWTSSNAGKGKLTLYAPLENAEIKTLLILQDGKFQLPGTIRLQVLDGQNTKVIWENIIQIGNNPIKRYIGKSVENIVHRDIDICLKGLKNELEFR